MIAVVHCRTPEESKLGGMKADILPAGMICTFLMLSLRSGRKHFPPFLAMKAKKKGGEKILTVAYDLAAGGGDFILAL